MRITRTSLPGGAVVARSKRCRASRLAAAPRSSAARSTPGRQVDVNTVGSANTARSASAGWIDTSNARVTPSRKIQPQVVNSDMYMWSSTKTWLRSTARRSRYSGRSWCSIVASRRQQPRHVRLERDRQPVAEPALGAVADHPQEPGRGRRRSQPERRGQHQPAPALEHAVGEELEQERDERVRQRGQKRQPESHAQEQGLGLVAALERAPHRRQGPAAGRQSRTSSFAPSSPSSPKRDACSSNIVR